MDTLIDQSGCRLIVAICRRSTTTLWLYIRYLFHKQIMTEHGNFARYTFGLNMFFPEENDSAQLKTWQEPTPEGIPFPFLSDIPFIRSAGAWSPTSCWLMDYRLPNAVKNQSSPSERCCTDYQLKSCLRTIADWDKLFARVIWLPVGLRSRL